MDGRAVRWRRHNDERRQRIIDAAIGLIDAGEGDASLQRIGEAAGLSRSVVYRHFADRRELDLAVQKHVLDGLLTELAPALELRNTIRSTIEQGVGAYVGWAVEHPRLHVVADVDLVEDGTGPLQQVIGTVAGRIAELLIGAFEMAGAKVTEADKAAADPLSYGLVGMIFGGVRRWVHLGEQVPDAEHMVQLITESVLALLDARAKAYGLVVDPDRPLEEVLRSPA